VSSPESVVRSGPAAPSTPYVDADAHPDTNAVADADAYSVADSDPYADAYSDADADAYSDADSHADADAHTNPDAHADVGGVEPDAGEHGHVAGRPAVDER